MHTTDDEKREKSITEFMEKIGMERRKAEKLYDVGIRNFDGLVSMTLTTLEKLVDDTQPWEENKHTQTHEEGDEIKQEDEVYFECPLCMTKVEEHAEECSHCKAHFAQGEIKDVQYMCPSCNSPVEDDATKCGKCGKKFDE